jgi:hypothetical protein
MRIVATETFHQDFKTVTSKNSSFDVPTNSAVDHVPVISSGPCWRSDCPNPRRNHIFVSPGKAGFDDRLVAISRSANLAGYLCANLYVYPPRLMLHPKHNQGHRVSTDLKWSDFLHFDFGFNQTIQELSHDFVSADDFRDSSGRAPDVVFTSFSYTDTWDTFHALENFTWMQNRPRSLNGESEESNSYFVWHIQTPIVKMNLFRTEDPIQRSSPVSFPFLWITPPENDNSCVYMNPRQLEPSEYISEIANSVWKTFSWSHIGVLHLRRGDSSNWCDTSVSRIQRFLECSFQNSTSLGNITLLLSSDELDTSYIQEITSLADDNPSLSNIQIRWLDEMIKERIQTLCEEDGLQRLQNNYIVYAVTKEVRKRATFFMEQRRNINCPDCLPILDLIEQA